MDCSSGFDCEPALFFSGEQCLLGDVVLNVENKEASVHFTSECVRHGCPIRPCSLLLPLLDFL
ncbi:hypothetical protein NQZ68_008615 [Dissostichus eleginoides]|nr:hypothetical protein NQZ68_008615 [Dissostichus eleginoides]